MAFSGFEEGEVAGRNADLCGEGTLREIVCFTE
jgi:hypothetical protein